jgi:hypothetical protein
MIYKLGWFLNLILPKWVAGITIAPFGIYLREDVFSNYRINNHENIHWTQQMEMLIVFFYLWYLFEWLIKLSKYGKETYRNLSFEREAKHGEMLDYYEIERKPYAWIHYL